LEHAQSNTWFVVQAYRKGRRGALTPEEPKMARNEANCLAMAERLAITRPAVVAFKRKGDPDTGDFDDPVILATFGDVPEMG
jgi:hypothetical protein